MKIKVTPTLFVYILACFLMACSAKQVTFEPFNGNNSFDKVMPKVYQKYIFINNVPKEQDKLLQAIEDYFVENPPTKLKRGALKVVYYFFEKKDGYNSDLILDEKNNPKIATEEVYRRIIYSFERDVQTKEINLNIELYRVGGEFYPQKLDVRLNKIYQFSE